MRDGPTLAKFPAHSASGRHASSDERLVECVAAGDRLAMEILYARHHVRVYRFALRLVNDAATAEDVTSDAFLDVWKQAGRFGGRRLRRGQVLAFFSRIPRCVVGLEACATAHYWARKLGALGHEVRLMPAQYVKEYIKRNKHDAADAEAICEAVQRPTMRFVPVKTAEQQAAQLLHRGREQLLRSSPMLPIHLETTRAY